MYVLGAHATLEKEHSTVKAAMGMNHGAADFWKIVSTNPTPSEIPDAQFFSEANGGEFRKSFHGYPAGYAQLIYSPTTFKIQPMQIDTHNREYNGTGFKVMLLAPCSRIGMVLAEGLCCAAKCVVQRNTRMPLHRPHRQEVEHDV